LEDVIDTWLGKKKKKLDKERTQQDKRIHSLIEHMDLGATLTTLRQEAKLTQSELAAIAGVYQSQIAKIEAGHNTNPTIETLIRLISCFGYTLSIVKKPH
jgi:DNA-binding XRE family transcriptional regulator